MKIGIVGLGNICKKAYLPVITAVEGIDLIFCTRNKEKLEKLSEKYRVSSYVTSVDDLIALKVDAAFVHTSTESHVEIIEKLLTHGVHVYVDKPISYDYRESLRMAELSKRVGKILMVGFNRRFAPMYKALKKHGKANIVTIEKNRVGKPNDVTTFILDDFIHVVDTLRFLMDGEITDIKVHGFKKQGLLYNVVVTLSNENITAIGIMNRDSGMAEEVVEYMSSGNKLVVRDLVNTTHFKENIETKIKFKDWDPMLYRRGFYHTIECFLHAVENNEPLTPSIEDSLVTHQICEEIINLINK
jgi:virulence factor